MKPLSTSPLARTHSMLLFLGLLLPLLSLVSPRVGWGQAGLPTAHNGPWQIGLPNGWSQSGLGGDYPGNLGANSVGGSAKFDDTGDVIIIRVAEAVGSVNYYVKGNPGSGQSTQGTFVLEESVDAISYTVLNSISNKSNVAEYFSSAPLLSSRYIRFRYLSKIEGNIQLDQVALTAANANPATITVPTGPLTFSTTVGTSSAEQSYSVTGANLTEPISITAPVGYQLSTTTGSYGSATNTLQLPASGGNVYVRLSGTTTGTYNGNIAHSSTGAPTANVAVQGNVAAVASIVASPTSISGLSATQGTASPPQMYTLTPTSLSAPITVTAPAGFEVSLASASGFAASITASRTAATDIYVRIAASAPAGPVSGTITNVSGSASQNVLVNGTVNTAPAGGSICLSEGFESATFPPVGWIRTGVGRSTTPADIKNGGAAAVFNSENGSLTTPMLANPSSLSFYLGRSTNTTAKTLTVQVSTESQDGMFIPVGTFDHTNVPSGSYNQYTVDLSGYTASPQVWIRFVKTSATTSPWRFDDLSVTCGAPAPAAQPTVQPTVSVTDITSNTANINVAGGNGVARLVVIRPTAVAAAAPSDGTTYTASTTYGAGATTGPNNFVLVANGTTTSFTVTGLSPLIGYTVDVYAYNGSGGTQNYLTTMPGTAAFTTSAMAIATYTWNGTASSWSAASSWTPTRTAPASNDILLFDGNVTPSATAALDFTSSQTIGQLQLVNRVSVTLTNAGSGRTLLLDGSIAGDDLLIGVSSALRLEPSTTSSPIIIDITVGETARIAGAFTSDAAPGIAGANRLIGREANAVVVPAGGLFVAGPNTTGGPFEGSAPNAVVFERGANYRQEGGSNPFDLPQPAALVDFQSGSIYDFARTDGSPALSGRTYGLLRFSTVNTGLANMEGSSPLIILNNLEVAAPTAVGINLTGGIFIGGNILVDAGGSLNFNPSSASAVTLNGSVPQTVSGPGPVVFGSASTLTISNASGVTLLAPLRANGGLNLQTGLLTTTKINLLTLAAGSVIEGGSAASFVNGPVARMLPANTSGNLLFPVGKQEAYRPVTLTPATLTQATTVTVEQLEGPPAPQPFNDGITRVSSVRRYAITASPGITTPGIFTGTVTLSFGPDDKVTAPTQPSLVIAQSDGTVWNSIGRSASTGAAGTPPEVFVAGTLTSAPFQTFDAFSVFALASTDPDASVNPLPVQLLSFGAERRPAGVQVRWATAAEQNSASFEVQRSVTGQAFRTIATVAAQGTSTSRREYTILDQQPLSGTGYYRLHQLDHDGKSSYSVVVSVAAAGEVRVYPNPVQTNLTVELPASGGRYRILSLLGDILAAGEVPGNRTQLDMTGLPTGLYQLEITTPAGREMHKIIKQ